MVRDGPAVDGHRRAAVGSDRSAVAADRQRPGYSPITAQRKPIMMKKPLNSAIRPIPPYGESAPSWGTSCRPIPKTTAQPMNRNANRNFAFGLVTRADPARAALGREADFEA